MSQLAEWMGADPVDLWTIAVAMLGNTACAIVGCYLVVRRMSMMGDAISHSMLAAIGVVFLVTKGVAFLPMFIGAVTVGVLTGVMTEGLHKAADVPEDSSMGVVFTSLFALGVVLISMFPGNDLDTRCVLMGYMEHAGLNTMSQIASGQWPVDLVRMTAMLAVVAGLVTAFWKELKLAAFDPALADAMGFHPLRVHYLLMAMVAGVCVTSMSNLGAIVVIAMLIVPAATAQLLTDRFGWMLVYAVLLSWAAAILGYVAALWVGSNAAGMMAVVSGLIFLLAVFFAPAHGLTSKWVSNMRLRLRILCEDILAQLYRAEERAAEASIASTVSSEECAEFAGGGFGGRVSMWLLRGRNQIAVAEDNVRLTDAGRKTGRSLLRSHRLWETYISKHFELDADHLHEPAHRVEHFIGPELQDRMAAELDEATDPHGREIPGNSDE